MRSFFWADGDSVAKASAARQSMIRFTHSICTARRGVTPNTPPTTAITREETFTVHWNCRNLRMASYTFLPQTTAVTREEKRSSVRTMSEASLQTSVPERPIAKPTSACASAAASFVPSPVTATTQPLCCRAETRRCLSNGVERASTLSFCAARRCAEGESARNSRPSITSEEREEEMEEEEEDEVEENVVGEWRELETTEKSSVSSSSSSSEMPDFAA